jgi:hypothetical protein
MIELSRSYIIGPQEDTEEQLKYFWGWASEGLVIKTMKKIKILHYAV